MKTDTPEFLQNMLTRVEDLHKKFNTLMAVAKGLNAQVGMIDSRLSKLEISLGLQEEPMKTQTAAEVEPTGPDQSGHAH